jgi:hypothetical protein
LADLGRAAFFDERRAPSAKRKVQSAKTKLKIQNSLFNFELCVVILHFSL